jgi:hypothetical protein
MALTLKAIRKMTSAEVDAALEAADICTREYRQLCKARNAYFEIRVADMKLFHACCDEFNKDIEESTYCDRVGSEDNHMLLIHLAEKHGWMDDVPSEAR